MELKSLKEKAFENREVREAYDALESEFALIDARVKQQSGLTQEKLVKRIETQKINRDGL